MPRLNKKPEGISMVENGRSTVNALDRPLDALDLHVKQRVNSDKFHIEEKYNAHKKDGPKIDGHGPSWP